MQEHDRPYHHEPGISRHLDGWQRPTADATGPWPEPGEARYAGPPPMTPPAAGWQTPHLVEPALPRPLPAQDHDTIDEEEARARTITRAFAVVAGLVLVVLTCALCSRVVLS